MPLRRCLATTLLALSACVGGCSSDSPSNPNPGAGSGGFAGSGGASGTGGADGASSRGSGGATANTSGRSGTDAAAGGSTGAGGARSGTTTTHGGAGGTSGGAGGASMSGAAGGTTGRGGAAGAASSGTGGTTSPGGGDAGTGGTSGGTGTGGTSGGAGSSGAGGSTSPASCPSQALKAGDTNRTVTVGSTSRTYVLHVPAKYDGSKAVPLVVDFHGLGSSGSGEEGSSPYKAQTDADGALSAYPDGVKGASGTAWNIGPCCNPGVDDVAFAKTLVKDVETVACIDPKRVYAVGFSIGGGMTHYLACQAADVFAAVSPAAADLLKENEDDCKPTRPITVFTFRGTADTSVPYAGGTMTSSGMTLTSIGAKATFEKWASIDQCTGSPSAEDSNGCSTYSTCGSGVQVTLCTKQGGGHEAGNATVSWPVLKKYAMP